MLKRDFFYFNNIKMRHLKNRSMGKCLVSYQFISLELFHPEQTNFDRTYMSFLKTSISQTIFVTEILRFEIASFFNLVHVWYKWMVENYLPSSKLSITLLAEIFDKTQIKIRLMFLGSAYYSQRKFTL